MAEQLSSFASAADRTEQQKQALLQAVAQAGAAGGNAYQAAQQQTNDLRGQAVGAALGAAQGSPLGQIGGGVQSLTAPIEQDFARRQADISQGAATFQQDIARQQAGGEEFFGRMQTAIPVVENYTRQAIERILAEERAEQEQRALQREMAQMQLQGAREDRADRAAERAARAQNGGLSVSERIAQERENREAFCFENPDDPKCQDSAQRKAANEEAYANAQQAELDRILASESSKVGSIIQEAMTYKDPIAYLRKLIGSTLETAADADKGGTGKSHRQGALNYEYIRDRVNAILNARPATNAPTVAGSGGGVDG